MATPTTPTITADPAGGVSIDDKNADSCDTASRRFLGLDVNVSQPQSAFGIWWWLACATYVTDQSQGGGKYRSGTGGACATLNRPGSVVIPSVTARTVRTGTRSPRPAAERRTMERCSGPGAWTTTSRGQR